MHLIQQAKSLVERSPGDSSFEADLAFHLVSKDALMHNCGGCLIWARPVKLSESDKWETYTTYDIKDCDAWFVWMAIGNMREFSKLLRYFLKPLRYVIRKKNNKFRIVTTKKLLELAPDGK